MQSIIAQKIDQIQGFLENGKRVPVTHLMVRANRVAQVKTVENDGYMALQLAAGAKKKISKSVQGHVKKAGIDTLPRFLMEVRVDSVEGVENGSVIAASDVLKAGDVIAVSGVSKGKGFAGGVKRYHFKGGPRTHGQSDRERAPGSIGQTTTPGRVYKGKKMAGKMGNEKVTVRNLEVLEVEGEKVLVKGLVPGVKGSVVMLRKVAEAKKFVPLFREAKEVVEEKKATEEVALDQKETSEEKEEKKETK